MKKLIFVIPFLFLFTFYNKPIYANNYYCEWENTFIDVPVKSTLDNYVNKPVAKLYSNGELIECMVRYFKGVDDTTLLSISPNYCDTYMVIYQANFSIDNKVFYTDKKEIYFNVVDEEKPIIVKNLEIEILYQKLNELDYLKDLIIKDNYTDFNDLFIDYDRRKLSIGKNRISYTCRDEFNNTINFERIINVIDNNAPKCLLLVDYLIINVNQEYDLNSNLVYEDESLCTVKIFHNIDVSKPNKYNVKYIVTDQGDNSIELEMIVEVVDNISPIIELNDNYYIDYDNLKDIKNILKNDIVKVFDNCDNLNLDDINIIYNIDYNKINVIFEIYDLSNNYFKIEREYKVINYPKPNIEVLDCYINNMTKENLLKNIIITDYKGKDITNNTIIITDYNDINKSGKYLISYSITDDYNNTIEFSRYINLELNQENTINNINSNNINIKNILTICLIILLFGNLFYMFFSNKK